MKVETDTHNISFLDLHHDSLHSRITRVSNVIPPMDQQFYFRIQRGVFIQAKLEITSNVLVVKGIITYENGMTVIVPDSYIETFNKILERSVDKMLLYYSRAQESIKLRVSTNLKDSSDISEYHIQDITSKLHKSAEILIKALSSISLTKSIGRNQFLSKKLRLKLLQNITRILLQKKTENFYSKLQNPEKGSCFKICHSIKQVDRDQIQYNYTQPDSQWKSNKFSIEKKFYRVVENLNEQQKIVQLAEKKPQVNILRQIGSRKIEKEAQIINNILDGKHFLTYWREQRQKNTSIYMDYVKDTFDDLIYHRYNSVHDILNFSKQLVSGVNVLHESGIVHRDLKPDNILVEHENHQNFKLKIIDFGESTLTNMSYERKNKEVLGYTIPYSPLECSELGQQGQCSKEIDYWSIGILMHEMAFLKNPITFSKPFLNNISKGWKMRDQFAIFPHLTKKKGAKILQFVLYLISLNTICIQPKQRANLKQIWQILQESEQFLDEIIQL